MTVYPNVKLNLGLRVLGKRPDGYHNLETVFVPYYGFSDCLEIVPAQSFDISLSGQYYTGWDPSEDLCARAWRLLRADFGIDPVHISLEKGSPVGAGLGGGSADGAFTLMVLNDLFSLGLSYRKLSEYAACLGSDCPFFIYNAPMIATGRGEVLEPIELPLDGYVFRVEMPEGVHVSTREAYEGLHAGRAEAGEVGEVEQKGASSLYDTLRQTPIEKWKEVIVNDFEPSVFKMHPQIAALKTKMYEEGAVYASMSGSGAAVFGIFKK